jgi:hypothetical protein
MHKTLPLRDSHLTRGVQQRERSPPMDSLYLLSKQNMNKYNRFNYSSAMSTFDAAHRGEYSTRNSLLLGVMVLLLLEKELRK